MNHPQCSIIVPVYKAEDYIDRCIESILNQTSDNWELILVDDGSPDNSGAICDGHASKDNRIKVLHQSNKGVSAARNNGLDNASGEYLLFLDSDDWLDNDCIEFCMNNMQKTGAEILQFPTIRVTSKEYSNNAVETSKDGVLYYTEEYIAQNNFFVCIGGTVFKKKIIDAGKIRFRDDIKLAEDQMFIMDCMKRSSKVYRTEHPFYKYFINENSATSKSKSTSMIDSVKALIGYKKANPEYTTTIDYTLLYFLWYIINNKDVPKNELSILIKDAKLKSSNKFSKIEKIFVTIGGICPNLSIYFVRFYKFLKK